MAKTFWTSKCPVDGTKFTWYSESPHGRGCPTGHAKPNPSAGKNHYNAKASDGHTVIRK